MKTGFLTGLSYLVNYNFPYHGGIKILFCALQAHPSFPGYKIILV